MTYLSHQDGEHTGRASRELAEHLRFLDNDINDLNGKLRRTAHIVVFAVFTFLLGLTLKIGGISLITGKRNPNWESELNCTRLEGKVALLLRTRH